MSSVLAGMAKRKRSDFDEEEEDIGEGPASPRSMNDRQSRSGQDLLEEEAQEQSAQRSTQTQASHPAACSHFVELQKNCLWLWLRGMHIRHGYLAILNTTATSEPHAGKALMSIQAGQHSCPLLVCVRP